METFGFSHDDFIKKSGLYSLLYGVDINYMRFLTSFGMTAILFLVRRGKGGIAALSSPKTSNTTVIPNVAKRNEESLAMMILSKSQG